MQCRGCGSTATDRVLDLGRVPAADHFPLASTPVSPDEASHPLAMELCRGCGLAQLAEDDTMTQEPRGVEPQALKDQAAEAVNTLDRAGWLRGDTVLEFGSPHGGSWLPLLTRRGFRAPARCAPASVVIDCFGMMHEPDQCLAFRERARSTAENGALLLQFHSLEAIVRDGQWNALRHGHFAYYSLGSLTHHLEAVGMSIAAAWDFDLYGGTVLIAAVHGSANGSGGAVSDVADRERSLVCRSRVASLQNAADAHARTLRRWLEYEASVGRRVFAYGAASRAVALFARAGLNRNLIHAVADASPTKRGRRLPGTDVPIIAPADLDAARPDRVLLTVPDLLPEVCAQHPELDGTWVVDRSPTLSHTAYVANHLPDRVATSGF